MTPREQARQDLIDNPEMQRSVFGREKQDGGYTAAIAVRTISGIVTGVIDFPPESRQWIPAALIDIGDALAADRSVSGICESSKAAEHRIRTTPLEPPNDRSRAAATERPASRIRTPR